MYQQAKRHVKKEVKTRNKLISSPTSSAGKIKKLARMNDDYSELSPIAKRQKSLGDFEKGRHDSIWNPMDQDEKETSSNNGASAMSQNASMATESDDSLPKNNKNSGGGKSVRFAGPATDLNE